MPRAIRIPSGLARLAADPDGARWLDALSGLGAECAGRWSLRLGEPYPDSFVSIVIPAVNADGETVVLKIQFPHDESEHEAEALRVWEGDGAVRLLDHAPDLHALLIEWCDPGTHLSECDPDAALDVLIGLLPRLWKAVEEPFTRLADEAVGWADGLRDQWRRAGRPFEEEIVDVAEGSLRELASWRGQPVLLHQDLHADNVLRAGREPWLVIDPKPLVGDPSFSAAPIVRSYELGHGRDAVVRRLDRLSAELDLDRDRVRAWTIGQTVAWAFEGDRVMGRHIETVRWLMASR